MQIYRRASAKGRGMQLQEPAAGPASWHNVGDPFAKSQTCFRGTLKQQHTHAHKHALTLKLASMSKLRQECVENYFAI